MLFGGGGGTGGAMTVAFHDVSGDLADNQYLATVIQFGLFGLLLYIGLLFTGARAFSSGPGKDDHNRPPIRLSGGIIVILAGLFGISGNILNVFPINLYFFSALALVATAQANGNS
jgi:O-antigen ligase